MRIQKLKNKLEKNNKLFDGIINFIVIFIEKRRSKSQV